MPFMNKSRQAIMRRSRLFITESKKRSVGKISGNSEIIVSGSEIRLARLILTNYRIQTWRKRNSGRQSDPSFPQNLINGKKIILKKQNEIISDEREVAEIFMDGKLKIKLTIYLQISFNI